MRIHPGDQANITVRIEESRTEKCTMILETTNYRSCGNKLLDIYRFKIIFIFNLFQYIKYNTRHCLMWNPYHNSRCQCCQCCHICARLQDLCLSKVSNTAFCLGTSDFGCLLFVASIRWARERSLSKIPWLEWIRTPRFPGYLGPVGKHC